MYTEAVDGIHGLSIAEVPDYARNNHWMNALKIGLKEYGENREDLMSRLDKKNIQTRPVWRLNHMQEPYSKCQTYRIEKAVELIEESLCLPSSTGTNKAQINNVIDCLCSR